MICVGRKRHGGKNCQFRKSVTRSRGGPASQKCGVQCKKHSPAAFKLTGHEIGLKGAKILEGYFKKPKKGKFLNCDRLHNLYYLMSERKS